MSYSRQSTDYITIRGTARGSVSYPASEHGGTMPVSVPYSHTETVHINVHVDTVQFDGNVGRVNRNVDLLTGAVIATEAAEIQTKRETSMQIGETILRGFFRTISSELEQQIVELTERVNSTVMTLRDLAKATLSKTKQMETDYNRISGHYHKIFGDLNHELENRITEIDKPAFRMKREIDGQKVRAVDSDSVNTVLVAGSESNGLVSKLSASVSKARAYETLDKARMFIMQQKELNRRIQSRTFNDSREGEIYIPIGFVQTLGDKLQIGKEVYLPDINDRMMHTDRFNKVAISNFEAKGHRWEPVADNRRDLVELYFNSEADRMPEDNAHDKRVKDMLRRIADIGAMETLVK